MRKRIDRTPNSQGRDLIGRLVKGLQSLGMTAIAGVWTPNGFVLGADGLTKNEHGQTICEHTQKIFFASKVPDYNLAYAWCGNTALNLPNGWFDFFETSADVVRYLASQTITGPADRFIRAFSVLVHDHLVVRLGGMMIPTQKFQLRDDLIACLSFMGFVDGTPIAKQVFFLHDKYQLESPRICDPEGLKPGLPLVISGPSSVLDRPRLSLVRDLQDGIRAVQNCIQECIDAPRMKNDPEYGGRIHIAIVTLDKTDWAEPPIGKTWQEQRETLGD
jgi:hypothetical protein